MRCACIDLGSNTTRLLVAEGDGHGGLRTIREAKALTRLGADRAPDGRLDPHRLAAAVRDVAAHALLARAAGAERILVVATAALREAPDGEHAEARVADAAGTDVVVLDGDAEARLAFRGAISALGGAAPYGRVAVVDAGGGSTEVVVGSIETGPAWAASVPIGSGRLADAELRSDPPAPDELARVRARARDALGELDPPVAVAGWAVGGSATSVARVLGGGDLGRAALAQAMDALCGTPTATFAARHGLHRERVRMLPAGLAILEAASERLGLDLAIAGGGLREGVILEMLGEDH